MHHEMLLLYAIVSILALPAILVWVMHNEVSKAHEQPK